MRSFAMFASKPNGSPPPSADAAPSPRNGAASSPAPAGGSPPDAAVAARTERPARTAAPRTGFPAALPETAALRDRRFAIQQVLAAWGPLCTAWFALPPDLRGNWTLRTLLKSLDEAALAMAERWHDGIPDERTLQGVRKSLGAAVAESLAMHRREKLPLTDTLVSAVAGDLDALRGYLQTASPRPSRLPPSILVSGAPSLALTLQDVAVQLLPPLVRFAGPFADRCLQPLLDAVVDRASAVLTARTGALPMPDRDRQSLFQSIVRREADILAACLEELPPAGIGSLGRGLGPLDQAMERYRERSEELDRIIARLLERLAPHAATEPGEDAGVRP